MVKVRKKLRKFLAKGIIFLVVFSLVVSYFYIPFSLLPLPKKIQEKIAQIQPEIKESQAAISLVSSGALGAGAKDGANVTLTFPAGVVTGDVVILFGGHYRRNGSNLGPSTGGYTPIATYRGEVDFGAWYKVMNGSPDANVVGYGSGNLSDVAAYGAYILRGVDASILDQTTATAGPATSTNPDAASIITQTDGAWVIAVAGSAVVEAGPTAATGYNNIIGGTQNDTLDFSSWGMTKQVSSAGTENPGAFGAWSSGGWYAFTLAIKPAPTAPTTVTHDASNITDDEATLNATTTATGGATVSARGFAVSKNSTLSINISTTSEDGGPWATAPANYTYSTTTLDCETPYYFRAYGTNSAGTGYGSIVTFTTGACPVAGGTISSATNQTFQVYQRSTEISEITITDVIGGITSGNDLRIAIDTASVFMLWDTTVTKAVLDGTASTTKVTSASVTYEAGGSVAKIDVDTTFSNGETLLVSGLKFANFTASSTRENGLMLYLGGFGDSTAEATDDKTITINHGALIDMSVADPQGAIINSPVGVFASSTAGYVLYVDSADDLSYAKTTDGGNNWSTTAIESAKTWETSAVWFDQWTNGDTGTKIHMIGLESGTDDLWYTYLDTADNTLRGGGVVAADLSSGISLGDGVPSITQGTDGDLYAVWCHATPAACEVVRSQDNGDSWADITPSTGMDDSGDLPQVVPLSGGDILLIKLDETDADFVSNIWDDSVSSWLGWVTIDASITIGASEDSLFQASINKKTFDVYLSYNNDVNSATGDIRMAVFDDSERAWHQATDIATNLAGAMQSGVAIDENNGDLYGVYIRGTPGTATDIYSKKSTDNGNSWESEVRNSSVADDIKIVSTNCMSSHRLAVFFYNYDLFALWYALLADLEPNASITSAADQSFEIDQSSTEISQITIKDIGNGIKVGNDIRIAIATSSVHMLWDTTIDKATLGGTASSTAGDTKRVNSASITYEGGGSVAVIGVDANFIDGETLTIEGLKFTSFSEVNAAYLGALRIYLDGPQDITANNTDYKKITISGKLEASEHSQTQITNQWSEDYPATTTIHYRYNLTPTGEVMNISTTTIALSGISGVTSGNIASAKLYVDYNSDAKLSTSTTWGGAAVGGGGLNNSWPDETYEYVDPIVTYNDKLYAGLGNDSGDGEVWEYNDSTSSPGWWQKIGGDGLYNSWPDATYEKVRNLVVNNSKLYAGLGADLGDAEVWEYNDSTSSPGWWQKIGGDGLYNSWVAADFTSIIPMISWGSRLYIGTASSTADSAEVWEYNNSTSSPGWWKKIGGGGLNGSWTGTLFKEIDSMEIHGDSLFVGTGSGAGYGEVWQYRRYEDYDYSSGYWTQIGGDGIGDSWGIQGDLVMFLESFNDFLYAGLGYGDGDAEVWEYDTSTSTPGQWHKMGGDGLYNSWDNNEYGYVFSSEDIAGRLNVGLLGDAPGEGEVWAYNSATSSPGWWQKTGGDGVNNSWADSVYGAVRSIASFDNKLYAGLATTTGAAEVWELGYDMQVGNGGGILISGSSGTITFATTTTYSISTTTDFLVELSVTGLELGDAMTMDFYNASTTGAISSVAVTLSGNPSSIAHSFGAFTMTVSDHSELGQVTNQWSGGLDSKRSIHYRYNLTSNTAMNVGTTTIALSGVTGVTSSNITSARLYVDYGSDNSTTSAGQFDTSWGAYGTTTPGIIQFSSNDSYAYAMTTDSDGSVYVAGNYYNDYNADYDWMIQKYTSLGQPDTSWGAVGTTTPGVIVYSNNFGTDYAYAIAIDSDKSIYVAGSFYQSPSSDNYWMIQKYTSVGALDTSWGAVGTTTQGMVIYANMAAPVNARIYAITIDSDKSIYVGGIYYNPVTAGTDWMVQKRTSTGALDTSWGGVSVAASGTTTPGVVVYGSNEGALSDNYVHAIAIDSDKSIYVTGDYYNPVNTDYDWMIQKYTSSGALDTSWGAVGTTTQGIIIYSFNSPTNDPDIPRAIAVDSDKNVYVAGDYANTETSDKDWMVRKYTSLGQIDTSWGAVGTTTQGMVVYSSGYSDDQVNGMVLDSDKNIYIVGDYANSVTADMDWMIQKRTSTGALDTSWGAVGTTTPGVIVYENNSANDYLYTIAIDSNRSTYAAGYHYNAVSSNSDWMIQKYTGPSYLGQVSISASTGIGTINFATSTTYGVSTSTDFIIELEITGLDWGSVMTMDFYNASTTSISGTTVAISGDAASVNHVFGAASISMSVSDHTMEQVSNQWTSGDSKRSVHYRYQMTPTGAMNVATTSIALSAINGVDAEDITSARLYVDYNSDNSTTSPGQLDTSWGAYGTTTPGIVWYSNNGNTTNADSLNDIVMDSDGSIYVAGSYFNNRSASSDWMIQKYTSSGQLDTSWGAYGTTTQGVVMYGTFGSDVIDGIAVDDDNNIYAGGYFYNYNGVSGSYDWMIQKYTSLGQLDTSWGAYGTTTQGMAIFSNNNSGLSSINAITIDSDNNIYAAGYYYNSANADKDWMIQKYTSSGQRDTSWGAYGTTTQGVAVYSNNYGDDKIYGIAVGSDRSIYVAGGYYNGFNADTDWMIQKYTSSGQLDTSWGAYGTTTQGVVMYSNNTVASDEPLAITIDSDNSIYVGGYYYNSLNADNDWMIQKYTSLGQLDTSWGAYGTTTQGVIVYSSTSSHDQINAITIDSDNSIYVGGYYYNSFNADNDWMIQKYTSLGQLDTSWGISGIVTYLNNSGGDLINAIAIDSGGGIYAAGSYYSAYNAESDFMIQKYTGPSYLGQVSIANGVGRIDFATSTTYSVSTTTNFVIELEVINLADGDTMTMDFYNASTTRAINSAIVGVSGDPLCAIHSMGSVSAGTIGKLNHAAGQEGNKFNTSELSLVAAELFSFRLTQTSETIHINALAISITDVTGFVASNITDPKIWVDADNDGTVDAGETTSVGGTGVVLISGGSGTITFSTAFSVASETNYILTATTTNIQPGDELALDLVAANMTCVGATSGVTLTAWGGVTTAFHIKSSGAAGGTDLDSSTPSGTLARGANSQASGEEIGSEAGFMAPSSYGSPSDQWADASYALSSDGLYATSVTAGHQEDYKSFGFVIPAGNTIQGIYVKLEASASSQAGTIQVDLYRASGAVYTSVKTTGTMDTADAVFTLGSVSDTWSVSWSASDFSDANFRLRITAQPSGGNTIKIDAIQVQVYTITIGGDEGGGGEL